MTFLEAYIKEKVDAYQEPTREGTKKGEPIGLSKVKYTAALWTGLTSYKLEDIAKKVGKSYPLIKKWRTEEPFKAAGQELVKDFANKLFKHALKAARQNIPVSENNDHVYKAIQLEQGKPFPLILNDFADNAFYAKAIKNIVSELLFNEHEKIKRSELTDDEYRWQLDRVLAIYRNIGIEDPPEITKAYSDSFNSITPQLYKSTLEGNRVLTIDEAYTIVGSGSIVDSMKNK